MKVLQCRSVLSYLQTHHVCSQTHRVPAVGQAHRHRIFYACLDHLEQHMHCQWLENNIKIIQIEEQVTKE